MALFLLCAHFDNNLLPLVPNYDSIRTNTAALSLLHASPIFK